MIVRGIHRFIVRVSYGKGRGVFFSPFRGAYRASRGMKLFADPVLVFPNSDARAQGIVHRYTFDWDDDTSAIALGLGSLLNHSYEPNVNYRSLRSEAAIGFYARRRIEPGEELTINYGYDADDRSPVGFRVRQ